MDIMIGDFFMYVCIIVMYTKTNLHIIIQISLLRKGILKCMRNFNYHLTLFCD